MALGPGPEKATYDPAPDPGEARQDRVQMALESLGRTRDQAKAYFEARYGENVWFRAPETFGPFERWVWAVAGAHDEMAIATMEEIVEHFKQQDNDERDLTRS